MRSSELDVPSLPFKKPKNLIHLEQMARSQREAMDPYEVKEHIQEVAESLAEGYHKSVGGDYEGCVSVVARALSETGAAVGGRFGASMVGESERAACKVCRAEYLDDEF